MIASRSFEIPPNHLQLCQWQDGLEFLCFLSSEIVEPPEITKGTTSQTLDLLRLFEQYLLPETSSKLESSLLAHLLYQFPKRIYSTAHLVKNVHQKSTNNSYVKNANALKK